jgi:hypothetical protein
MLTGEPQYGLYSAIDIADQKMLDQDRQWPSRAKFTRFLIPAVTLRILASAKYDQLAVLLARLGQAMHQCSMRPHNVWYDPRHPQYPPLRNSAAYSRCQ